MNALLVDDHAIFREALALLFELRHPGVQLHQADSLATARAQLLTSPSIDHVLLDLRLPDSDGLPTLQAVREAAPMARVIVLSADDRRETVMAAIEAGAAGFIPKSADTGLLAQALATVVGGGVFVPPLTLLTAGPTPSRPATPESLGLTPRQVEVLRLLIEGKSNKTIGRLMDLSPSTVRTHVEAIFLRLDVHSRTQAVVAAARLGLRL